MYKFLAILIFCFGFSEAQELKCTLRVNSDKIGNTNRQVFKTLETSLNEFVNRTQWTSEVYKANEKISCALTIVVDNYESDVISGTLQIQSSRPIFNSTYASPVLNINDKNLSFKYIEFENFIYNPLTFDNNLISIIAFYTNLIIGSDKDTFAKQGGSKTLEQAQSIVNLAQGSGYKGWTQADGPLCRYFMINDMLSPNFVAYRDMMFDYHLSGMDIMESNPKNAKNRIAFAVNEFKYIHQSRPNSLLSRLFFDAKADEIVSIFSGGTIVDMKELLENVNQFSPMNSSKWNTIRN
jgi:Domain of unknown function (DUF4835)